MRTTIRLDDALLRQAKRRAAESGRTLTALIEEGLRTILARSTRPPRPARSGLPTAGEGGLRPGVDLDNSAALQAVMVEER
jgi:predicted transcriptional regulator